MTYYRVQAFFDSATVISLTEEGRLKMTKTKHHLPHWENVSQKFDSPDEAIAAATRWSGVDEVYYRSEVERNTPLEEMVRKGVGAPTRVVAIGPISSRVIWVNPYQRVRNLLRDMNVRPWSIY